MPPDAPEAADPDERIEVSIIVKPRSPLGELQAAARPMSREEFAANYGADPDDIARVEDFARRHGLEVVEASQPRRTVVVAGRSAEVAAAFGVSLVRQRLDDGTEYRAPDHEVQIPPELQGIVEGIFGLDTRPIARHHG
jgi:kumamolisin